MTCDFILKANKKGYRRGWKENDDKVAHIEFVLTQFVFQIRLQK
jgi:hypothetical protein